MGLKEMLGFKKQGKGKDKEQIKGTVKKGANPLSYKTEQMTFIKDNCELVAESERQIEEAKMEYQAVTSYLTDIQRIDMIPKEQRFQLEESARKIYLLTQERMRFQNRKTRITDRQYRLFERYEMQLPKELPAIKESEEYQDKIEKDIEYLKKEKKVLAQEQEDIISKQGFLKGIAITTCIIVIILFIIFALLGSYTDAKLSIPFLLTVLMGMVSALYIFMEARKNDYDMQIVQTKQKRQIMLMNKVKIKSVNNLNFLEYTYNKYMVDSYDELKALWEEYIMLKDENRRYLSNTELLEFYNKELVKALANIGLADAEIWIYQPAAILDHKEMVEIRHRLNVRRQKLRERIDSCMQQKEEALQIIKGGIEACPECREESSRLLSQFGIQI